MPLRFNTAKNCCACVWHDSFQRDKPVAADGVNYADGNWYEFTTGDYTLSNVSGVTKMICQTDDAQIKILTPPGEKQLLVLVIVNLPAISDYGTIKYGTHSLRIERTGSTECKMYLDGELVQTSNETTTKCSIIGIQAFGSPCFDNFGYHLAKYGDSFLHSWHGSLASEPSASFGAIPNDAITTGYYLPCCRALEFDDADSKTANYYLQASKDTCFYHLTSYTVPDCDTDFDNDNINEPTDTTDNKLTCHNALPVRTCREACFPDDLPDTITLTIAGYSGVRIGRCQEQVTPYPGWPCSLGVGAVANCEGSNCFGDLGPPGSCAGDEQVARQACLDAYVASGGFPTGDADEYARCNCEASVVSNQCKCNCRKEKAIPALYRDFSALNGTYVLDRVNTSPDSFGGICKSCTYSVTVRAWKGFGDGGPTACDIPLCNTTHRTKYEDCYDILGLPPFDTDTIDAFHECMEETANASIDGSSDYEDRTQTLTIAVTYNNDGSGTITSPSGCDEAPILIATFCAGGLFCTTHSTNSISADSCHQGCYDFYGSTSCDETGESYPEDQIYIDIDWPAISQTITTTRSI